MEPPAEPAVKAPNTSRLYRYRLIHLMYVVTFLAVSLATFGAAGLLLGVFVCVFWESVFTSATRPRALLYASVVALVCWFLFSCLLLASSRGAREAARRMSCMNNLKQISLALHNYHDTYRSLPPAYVADENGKRLHSWRVLLLPFLGEQPLYDQYDFSQPWNGPRNKKLLDRMPSVYACPSDMQRGRRPWTSYVAITGPSTAWPGSTAATFSDFQDGIANTVLVAEIGGQEIPWLEPRDVPLDAALKLLVAGEPGFGGNHQHQSFLYRYLKGRNVVFADGRVKFVEHGLDRQVWSALLGKDDGVAWDDDDLEGQPETTRQLRVDNCVRLALIVGLALIPLPWVWLNPTSGGTPASTVDVESSAND